ncbi:hypothetical protein Q8F57_045220 [Paraburkholderia terrae]|uniref:hypothetical protein n=1 Tax=Paraburkholderia terrae TaxID=311230 RepID=UPI00296AABE6|nr:hypothetical protein [Paraburkholderia terrae]MDW3663187.1 hypothetical protein [Paraburkholderia terrae]
MFNVTSAAGLMTGSCDRAAKCQLASHGKTRHLYLAGMRHSHIAATHGVVVVEAFLKFLKCLGCG